MTTTTSATIERARAYLRNLDPGRTMDAAELRRRVGRQFPALWPKLTPSLQAAWAWRQAHGRTPELAWREPSRPPDSGLFDGVRVPREERTRAQAVHALEARLRARQRHLAAAQREAARTRALAAWWRAAHGDRLELPLDLAEEAWYGHR